MTQNPLDLHRTLQRKERELKRWEEDLGRRERVLEEKLTEGKLEPDVDPLVFEDLVVLKSGAHDRVGRVQKTQRVAEAAFHYHIAWPGGKTGTYRRKELLRLSEVDSSPKIADAPRGFLDEHEPARVNDEVYRNGAVGRILRVQLDRHYTTLGMLYHVRFGDRSGTFRRRDFQVLERRPPKKARG